MMPWPSVSKRQTAGSFRNPPSVSRFGLLAAGARCVVGRVLRRE